jgi:hypothetical protein
VGIGAAPLGAEMKRAKPTWLRPLVAGFLTAIFIVSSWGK